MSTTNEITVRPYTTTKLAALYGVARKTFRMWLQPHASVIGEKQGKYFTVLQVKMIFEKLGIPE